VSGCKYFGGFPSFLIFLLLVVSSSFTPTFACACQPFLNGSLAGKCFFTTATSSNTPTRMSSSSDSNSPPSSPSPVAKPSSKSSTKINKKKTDSALSPKKSIKKPLNSASNKAKPAEAKKKATKKIAAIEKTVSNDCKGSKTSSDKKKREDSKRKAKSKKDDSSAGGSSNDAIKVAKKKAKHAQEAKKLNKKEKDPNAPKRPSTAFIHFCMPAHYTLSFSRLSALCLLTNTRHLAANAERVMMKKEQPQLKGVELSKALGAKWKELSVEEKKPFLDLYQKDKARFTAEMENYSTGTTVVPAEAEE